MKKQSAFYHDFQCFLALAGPPAERMGLSELILLTLNDWPNSSVKKRLQRFCFSLECWPVLHPFLHAVRNGNCPLTQLFLVLVCFLRSNDVLYPSRMRNHVIDIQREPTGDSPLRKTHLSVRQLKVEEQGEQTSLDGVEEHMQPGCMSNVDAWKIPARCLLSSC